MPLTDRASAITHMIVVADLGRAKRWYLDVLGCSLYGEYGGTSVVLDWNGTWLLLVTGGDPTPDKPGVVLAASGSPNLVSRTIIFRVADCRGTYDELRGLGAEFLTEPVDHGYEIRAFFRDPDGNLFEISELVAGDSAAG
jgi:catechol 2,3-dioxygenase-like lactoylglutathione lyase family enzyme